MKKIEKINRPFRYDLNQIPYDYNVEVIKRFKGLDLVERVAEEVWMNVLTIVKEVVIKTISKEKMQENKVFLCFFLFFFFFFEEALQISEERREVKGKGERERDTQLKARVPKNSNRREEDFLK